MSGTTTVAECPKCGYVRQASDTAPPWQCPACEVAYGKYVAPVCPRCGHIKTPHDGGDEKNCSECGTPYGKQAVPDIPWCDEDGTIIPEAWRAKHRPEHSAPRKEIKPQKPAGTPVWGVFSIGLACSSLIMPYIVSIFLLPFAFTFGIVSCVVRRPWLGFIGILLSAAGLIVVLIFSAEMARELQNIRRF